MKLVPIKLKSLSTILLTLLVAACSPNENNNEDRIELHLKQSNAYQQQGQYRAAIIEARNIIKKAPDSELGFLRLGELLVELGNYKSASETLNQSPEQNNNLLLLLAKSYINQGKFISAEKTLASFTANQGDTKHLDFLLLNNQIQAKNLGFEKTLDQLISTSEQYPQSIEAKKQLIAALVNLKKIDEAKTALTKDMEINSSNSETLYLAANLAYLNKDLTSAEKHLTEALIALPDTDILTPLKNRVLRQLTTVLTEQGRSAESLIYSKLLAEADPESNQAKSKFTEALKLLQSGNLEEAEALLKELSNSYPSNELSDIYLGLINYQRGDLENADNLLSASLDTEVASPKLIQASALAKLRLQKNDEAFVLLESALKTYPDNEQLLTTYGINALMMEGKSDQGILSLEKALSINPQNIDLRIALSNYYIENKQIELGMAQLNKGLKLEPSNIKLVAAQVQALLITERKSEAEQKINKLVALQPNNNEALNLAAKFYLVSNQQLQAEKLYKQSLAIQARNLEALKNLGSLAIRDKNSRIALKYYRELTTYFPEEPLGYKGIVTAHEIAGNAEAGTTEVDKYTQKPGIVKSTAASILAEFYLRNQNITLATSYLDMAKMDSTKPAPYLRNVETAIKFAEAKKAAQDQDLDTARKRLLEAMAISPDNIQLYRALISIEINAKQYDEAQKLADNASNQFPGSPMPALVTAQISLLNNDKETALKALMAEWDKNPSGIVAEKLSPLLDDNKPKLNQLLKQWTELEPNNTKPILSSAILAQGEKNPQLAVALYKKAKELSPNNPIILNNLAWLYFEQKNDLAESTAKQAYTLAPNNPAILDTYGWILLQKGNIKLAKKYLKLAAELAPENQEIKEHYQMANTY